MQEKSSFEPQTKSLFNKFSSAKSPKERKKVREVLFWVFGLTLLLVGSSFFYQFIPPLLAKLRQPEILISKKFSQISPIATPTPRLNSVKREVLAMTSPLKGEYGVYFQALKTKEAFDINGEKIFTAASLIKLPVLLTLYRESEAGRIKLDDVYRLQEADKVGGAGSLQSKPAGYETTFRQMAKLMGEQSDNTAFNIVSKTLSDEKIQDLINALGMKNTSFADNTTTPNDLGLLFQKLYGEKIVYDQNKDEILAFLTNTIWEDRIPAGIPRGIKVSHKIGTEIGVISDAGIVFAEKPFILVIMSQEANEIEAKKALSEITKKIWEMIQGLDTRDLE